MIRSLAIFTIITGMTLVSCVTGERPKEFPAPQSACSGIAEVDPPFDPDPEKLAPELLLSSYLRVNTTNPGGCEGKAARFWKRFFDRYGIENEIMPLPFGEDRANFVARTRSAARGRPLILLHHMDVVPASAGQWSVPPFDGVIKDGFVYGRGAFDMKATAVIQALTLVKAVKGRWPLQRDVIFVATANEEGPVDRSKGVISGAEWLLKNKPKVLDRGDSVLTEGGYIAVERGQQTRWEVSPGEKARMELTVRYTGNHAEPERVNYELMRAAWQLMTRFERKIEIDDPAERDRVMRDPVIRANYETTHALTVLGGKGKGNTVAGEAFADLVFEGGAIRRTALESGIRRSLLSGAGISEIRQDQNDLKIKIKAIAPAGHASTPPLNGGAAMILIGSLSQVTERVQTRELPAKSVKITTMQVEAPGRESAEFVVDFRLMPGESGSQILEEVKKYVAGLPVALSVSEEPVIAPASPTETSLFESIASAHNHFTVGMKSSPALETPILVSTTDAAFFRKRGMVVYGFEPLLQDPSDERSHGDDERVAVRALRYAADVYAYIVKDFTGKSPAKRPAESLPVAE